METVIFIQTKKWKFWRTIAQELPLKLLSFQKVLKEYANWICAWFFINYCYTVIINWNEKLTGLVTMAKMNQKNKLLLHSLLTVINPEWDVTFPPGRPVTKLKVRAKYFRIGLKGMYLTGLIFTIYNVHQLLSWSNKRYHLN